ncbi:MAG: GntR family transcriptional regulator [Thermodesulfobacteriota bacterium]
MEKKQKNKTSLVEVARQAIEDQLLTGRLRPDQHLREAELAENFGISRTPLREALRQLETKGLIKKRHSLGYVVVYHSLEDIRNSFEVRLPLEKTAIRLACENATQEHIDRASRILTRYDEELAAPHKPQKGLVKRINTDSDWNGLFHKELYQAAGNELLTRHILNLRDLDRLIRITLDLKLADFQRFQAQHHKILNAVKQRNKTRAEKEVQEHILTLFRFYLRTASDYTIRI